VHGRGGSITPATQRGVFSPSTTHPRVVFFYMGARPIIPTPENKKLLALLGSFKLTSVDSYRGVNEINISYYILFGSLLSFTGTYKGML
jgi:hypothetical protein